MSERVEVVIIGAGPAGCSAATMLGRAGRTVALVDKARFPRDKCCGDGLTTLALRELEALDFDPSTVGAWRSVDGCWLRSPSGREVEVPLVGAGIYAAVAPRLQLDSALVDMASGSGARLVASDGLSAVAQTSTGVTVTLASGRTIIADYLIAADGMWSPTRKALGLAPEGYLGEWHGFRQYVGNVTGPAHDRMYVWFEADLLPGYAWSFPLPDGRVNLGFGILRDGPRKVQEMKTLWPELLARTHIASALGADAIFEGRHTAWPIPARVDQATLSGERVLFVGDAACATDLLTGEGIGQALLTGRLAAEAILASSDADSVAKHYERAVRHHLRADHRMSRLLNTALSHPRGASLAIRLVGLTQWTRRNFARWMFEDEARAVIFTPRRWHRRFLRRAGAYVKHD